MPHLVIMGFGGMDQALKNYTEDNFVNSYVQYIKAVQNLPYKPMVFLMVPIFTCSDISPATWQEEEQKQLFTSKINCTTDQQLDLQRIIYKIARLSDIPDHHFIDTWRLLRLNTAVPAQEYFNGDMMHPNINGMIRIAHEIYWTMSLSPDYLHRQN